MFSGGRDEFGSSWLELHHLDRLLAKLTRPVLPGERIPSAVREQLRSLGVSSGEEAPREELIARVWGRKRPLLHQLNTWDRNSTPPCA